MAKNNKTKLQLSKNLILNRYLLSLFGVEGFEALAKDLKTSSLEGLDENNVSKYHHELVMRMFAGIAFNKEQLLEYDQNIVSHTLAINEKRIEPIKWKYFQYLSLLFAEIYLDKYFQNKEALLKEINDYVKRWNDPNTPTGNESGYQAQPFELNDLNKLALWNATGSGKTLLMQVNIKQFLHYQNKYQAHKVNKVLLVTPNEGLSNQHLKEFKESGIGAELFSKKSGGMFSGTEVEVLEISKLAEEHGEKTVAVDAFETDNLVLVDEGHRGINGDQWKNRRDKLSKEGFAFEYSATFGQAVSAASGARKSSLVDEYSKNILFDYSYKYFYGDGYGKDYQILNVPDDSQKEFIKKYLTGALLAFYQQKRIFREHPHEMKTFNLADPLWVFVGGSVTKTLSTKESTDIIFITKFYSEFIKNSQDSKEIIKQLLEGTDGVLDQGRHSIFKNYFSYLREETRHIDELYQDLLETVFNTNIAGANLYIDNLNGIDGELGLRIGDAEYFGVINVGDDSKLFKLCQEAGLEGTSKDFSDSLFHNINEKNSKINLLIGSKKFTEGWSSWRVSTMGLMNIGRGEGSQIIQLFGRGVRLKGYQMSLKRSRELDEYQKPDQPIPDYIRNLETLNIFGIRADYMQQFKEYLEEEGLPSNDSRFIDIQIPVMPTVELQGKKLKVLKIKDGIDFKKDVRLTLKYQELDDSHRISLDWYPKVQVLRSLQRSGGVQFTDEQEGKLEENHLAFIDWDQVYFEVQKFKNERTWHNLSIPRPALQEIMHRQDWYTLYVPEAELQPTSYSKVLLWQDIVVALLKGYVDRFYNLHKSEYLGKHMESIALDPTHPNFIAEYKVAIEESQEEIIRKLHELKELVSIGVLEEDMGIGQSFSGFDFIQHLYRPLLYLDADKYKDIIKITPVAFNKGEEAFVQDLKRFYAQEPEFFEGKSLYVLRNQSRKGVGFFEAKGFFPDFILWLVDQEKQHICFIDPKGLRQIIGFEHPKMKFYRTIKEEIEVRLNDPEINLSSVIISMTPYKEVKHWRDQDGIVDFNRKHIFFREEQKGYYIKGILELAGKGEGVGIKSY